MITNKQKQHMKEVLEECYGKTFDDFCNDNNCGGIDCKDCPFNKAGNCELGLLRTQIQEMIEKLKIKTCKHCGKPLEED